jgi:hypothetical protein
MVTPCVNWLHGVVTYRARPLPFVYGSFSLICTTGKSDLEFVFGEFMGATPRVIFLAKVLGHDDSGNPQAWTKPDDIGKFIELFKQRINAEAVKSGIEHEPGSKRTTKEILNAPILRPAGAPAGVTLLDVINACNKVHGKTPPGAHSLCEQWGGG